MLTLGQIMTADPMTIGPETTLRDAVEFLSSQRISGVPVVSGGGRILGVVSASDILAFTASLPGMPGDRDDDGWELREASLEDDPYEDSFTGYWEDAGADVVARMQAHGQPEWDLLDEHTVADIMTRRLHAMAPETGLADAAAHMVQAGIHRLLVVERNRLVGVVSAMDFVKAIARQAATV